MRIVSWKVALSVIVCATLGLYAANKSEVPDTNAPLLVPNTGDGVPPGVLKADWHAISEDFGFVLHVTKEPPVGLRFTFGETQVPDDATDEEKRDIIEKHLTYLEELARSRSGVGRAQALFFARKAKKWYMVTTPPPPVGIHLLQSEEP